MHTINNEAIGVKLVTIMFYEYSRCGKVSEYVMPEYSNSMLLRILNQLISIRIISSTSALGLPLQQPPLKNNLSHNHPAGCSSSGN